MCEKSHLQPGPVHLRPDELGQLDLHFLLFLNRVKDRVEDRHGAFVLQQRDIHQALQSSKRSILSPVLNNIVRLVAP